MIINESIFPYGLNTNFNFKSFDNNECIYNIFKLFKNYNNNNRGKRGNSKNKIKYNLKDFVNDCINCYDEPNAIKSIKTKILGVKLNFHNKLLNFLKLDQVKINSKQYFSNFLNLVEDLARYRFKNNYKHKDLPKPDYFVLDFTNKIFNNLNINAIIGKNKNLLPIQLNCKPTFRYTKSLKNLICNYRNIATDNFNYVCNCDDFKDTPFFDNFHKHVITGDLDIIDNDNIKKFMSLGSKFRPSFPTSKNKVISIFIKNLDDFILKLSYKHNFPIEGFFEWRENIIKDFKINIKRDKLVFQKDLIFNSVLRQDIKNIQNKFCITTVDKASNNFAII